MSKEHFAVECLPEGCRLRDLNSSNGTTVNGKHVARANLSDGDKIVAGETIFTVSMKTAPADSAPQKTGLDDAETDFPLEIVKERVLVFFRHFQEPLFAILDAARDPHVLALLIQSDHEYQSLYEGTKGESLSDVAPYLVRLPSDSPLLETLVEKGWGDSWGVYLTCDKPFKEVRKHFRHFLMVKTDEGKEVYFRFYDPRVLRVFLPTCLPEEAEQFFGPIDSYYFEDEKPKNMLRFVAGKKGSKELIKLTQDPAATNS